jgi:transcriptional regulator with XRE-family HTH domain
LEQTLSQRLLHYAAERLGLQEVAARLKVSETVIQAWMQGGSDMPNIKRLALADLVHSLTRPG